MLYLLPLSANALVLGLQAGSVYNILLRILYTENYFDHLMPSLLRTIGKRRPSNSNLASD